MRRGSFWRSGCAVNCECLTPRHTMGCVAGPSGRASRMRLAFRTSLTSAAPQDHITIGVDAQKAVHVNAMGTMSSCLWRRRRLSRRRVAPRPQ